MQLSPIQIVIYKTPKNVECFKFLCSMITNNVTARGKLNPVVPRQKQHSTKIRLFTSKPDLNFKKELVNFTFGS